MIEGFCVGSGFGHGDIYPVEPTQHALAVTAWADMATAQQ